MERSRRYLLRTEQPIDETQVGKFSAMIHDRMTECVYSGKLSSFKSSILPEAATVVPVMEQGRAAIEEINLRMGLAFDEQDLHYYTSLFRDDIKRNPTNVELFDIAQSNSEHSRHWFFNASLIIDGEPMDQSLMKIVKSTLERNPNNSVIGFKDNSSAIKGFEVELLRPSTPGSPSPFLLLHREMDVLFTAETHNFPCAVAPFPGAETGAGGRIRDTHATGKGSFIIASTAGYCVGNLDQDGSFNPSFSYPSNLASPLQILIQASDGASDYGNKFGEPLIQGFTRSFGMRLSNGERREWIKPIMFSGGIGQIDHVHIGKDDPEVGMLVVKIGGPAYRIGMGGGAASSMVSGENDAELDFNAVQRGDAEMAQKLYRVVRTCAEMGDVNPIISIHDQGAGGNCNVVKEIIYPEGAKIDIRKVNVGDLTMSVLEIWGAEYQEQDAILVKPESEELMREICSRERVSMAVIGQISGDGKIVLVDGPDGDPVVDLDLVKVLGDMPRKSFSFNRVQRPVKQLDMAPGTMILDALQRVLRLTSVCSKRFLTTKVDRCVGGLVAQQQTVGPLQIPLSDVAVVALTYGDITGGACAIGEQPIKGLLDPKAMARLAVGEALTNLVWAKITSLADVKASGNWMYAAKLDGEGADMYDAATAMADAMIELGIAIDGGKDSLSMAARAGHELVKAPGNLVVSVYATCPDITLTVTPDLKLPEGGALIHVPISGLQRCHRLGGSALAHAFNQIGDTCPDLDDVTYLKTVFESVQDLISEKLISAGHDVSDGGFLVTALEMAFAGNCGIELDLPARDCNLIELLFSEELGLIMEIAHHNLDTVQEKLKSSGVSSHLIGRVTESSAVKVTINGDIHLDEDMTVLRDLWEETSFKLEGLQRLASCVEREREGLKTRKAPNWALTFCPDVKILSKVGPKVAIIREEGSNGDREMAAAFLAAGFDPWDVAMSDLLESKISLKDFKGVAFVGGFSYGDVLDSAKGWASSIQFNRPVLEELEEFYNRSDTFSLGVCNGCQLMALLGWVLGIEDDSSKPRFVHNESGRFECRFTSVRILPSPAIMLKGMEGSTLGVWSAHGEGRAFFPSDKVYGGAMAAGLAPVRYCDDEGKETEEYPFNPNGSPLGIAALCSEDGRHLAMMPHPERCFMMWQFPWYPRTWEVDAKGPSPWLKMFQNAREWCG